MGATAAPHSLQENFRNDPASASPNRTPTGPSALSNTFREIIVNSPSDEPGECTQDVN